jgi:hypothetical protein
MVKPATFLLIYFTALTWGSVAILFFLPDTWWGLAGKVGAAAWLLWLLPRLYFSNEYRPPHLYASVGVGIVVNTALFALLIWFYELGWLRWSAIALISLNLFIAHRTIEHGEIKKEDGN